LKQTLFLIFSKFGKVMSVTAKHNIRMRGQAFVTFEDSESARVARDTLNRALLFKKEMVSLPEAEYKLCKRGGRRNCEDKWHIQANSKITLRMQTAEDRSKRCKKDPTS
jgi:RNA recognition motif-containing protein